LGLAAVFWMSAADRASKRPRRAVRAVFTLLRPGGRFAAIVAGDLKRTTYNTIALDLLARHGGKTDWDDKPGSIR